MTKLAGQDVWLGLRINSGNQKANDIWWSDGSLVTYTNWSESDPTNQHAGELGILQVGGTITGGWKFVSYNASFPYVCKKGREEKYVSKN